MPKKGYKQSEEHKKKHSETTKGISNSGSFKKGHNKSVNCDWIGKGDKSHHWKGGRFVNSEGYVFILSPNHPYRTKLEYVRVMETHLGRTLLPNSKHF